MVFKVTVPRETIQEFGFVEAVGTALNLDSNIIELCICERATT